MELQLLSATEPNSYTTKDDECEILFDHGLSIKITLRGWRYLFTVTSSGKTPTGKYAIFLQNEVKSRVAFGLYVVKLDC